MAAKRKEKAKPDPLSKTERAFVTEYMVDFNPTRAAQRCGYARLNARAAAKRFMQSSLVVREVQALIDASDPTKMMSPQNVVAGFMREANSTINSGSERLAALRSLATVAGLKIAPDKGAGGKGKTIKNPGVILLPGEVPLDNWERMAIAAQADLKERVRE